MTEAVEVEKISASGVGSVPRELFGGQAAQGKGGEDSKLGYELRVIAVRGSYGFGLGLVATTRRSKAQTKELPQQ